MSKYELDEKLDPRLNPGWVVGWAVIVLYWIAVPGISLVREQKFLLLAVYALAAIVLLALHLILAWKKRLQIGAAGVTVHRPFRRNLVLTWEQMRTTVRVYRKVPLILAPPEHLIVLSPLEEAKVLKLRRFRWRSGRRDGEIRLAYTDERRLAIEHWLSKELPVRELRREVDA